MKAEWLIDGKHRQGTHSAKFVMIVWQEICIPNATKFIGPIGLPKPIIC